MIKLFRKLAINGVEMGVDQGIIRPTVILVTFRKGNYAMQQTIDLDEFTEVWGGDHVLENVLEACLDEFLSDIGEKLVAAMNKAFGGEVKSDGYKSCK